MPSLTRFDLVIVGGGLSAYALVSSLLDCIEQSPVRCRLAIFDKSAELWRGVPYGKQALKEYFLIDNLKNSRCPGFRKWILLKREELANYLPENSCVLSHWYSQNKQNIREGNIDEVFFPRFLFGCYLEDCMSPRIDSAIKNGWLAFEFIPEEVMDIQVEPTNKYEILSRTGRRLHSNNLVLATGSVPRPPPKAILKSPLASRYIDDSQVAASFDLPAKLAPLAETTGSRKSVVCIIGAAASAVETLFYISTKIRLKQAIGKIIVISRSGYMVGGWQAENCLPLHENALPDYVRNRSSSITYLEAVSELMITKLCVLQQGHVDKISQCGSRFTIQVRYPDAGKRQISHENKDNTGSRAVLEADWVINCSGSGSLRLTENPFLKRLSEILPVNKEQRGFAVNEQNEIDGFAGVYALGPLLNSHYSGRQVESIEAVLEEGKKVAKALHATLSRNHEKSLTSSFGACFNEC